MQQQTIGFIGAGQMATALARGLVNAGIASADALVAYDPAEVARQRFLEAVPGAVWAEANEQLVKCVDVVVLAVKPQYVADVARALSSGIHGKLMVSIAAGVPLAQLTRDFRSERIIRVMPNMPCLVARGAAAYALGSAATQDDADLVQHVLEAVGVALAVPENLLDAVTGLSGSGPAFVAMFIEALADGGVRVGLPREVSLRLAAETVRGTAEMMLDRGLAPAEIKDQVASPGGTTIAGIHALEERAFRGTVMAAVEAATHRARQLGESSAGAPAAPREPRDPH